ncbi:uncharacterized protein LOC141850911 isoform X1 [Brevipalpus obovatus]|uniref:uncharacterized protein LOC141850911 isoform X1 n=2 Tax=Brevipalpus obovatus TaxID=246614 RepID=UPI003D9ECB46
MAQSNTFMIELKKFGDNNGGIDYYKVGQFSRKIVKIRNSQHIREAIEMVHKSLKETFAKFLEQGGWNILGIWIYRAENWKKGPCSQKKMAAVPLQLRILEILTKFDIPSNYEISSGVLDIAYNFLKDPNHQRCSTTKRIIEEFCKRWPPQPRTQVQESTNQLDKTDLSEQPSVERNLQNIHTETNPPSNENRNDPRTEHRQKPSKFKESLKDLLDENSGLRSLEAAVSLYERAKNIPQSEIHYVIVVLDRTQSPEIIKRFFSSGGWNLMLDWQKKLFNKRTEGSNQERMIAAWLELTLLNYLKTYHSGQPPFLRDEIPLPQIYHEIITGEEEGSYREWAEALRRSWNGLFASYSQMSLINYSSVPLVEMSEDENLSPQVPEETEQEKNIHLRETSSHSNSIESDNVSARPSHTIIERVEESSESHGRTGKPVELLTEKTMEPGIVTSKLSLEKMNSSNNCQKPQMKLLVIENSHGNPKSKQNDEETFKDTEKLIETSVNIPSQSNVPTKTVIQSEIVKSCTPVLQPVCARDLTVKNHLKQTRPDESVERRREKEQALSTRMMSIIQTEKIASKAVFPVLSNNPLDDPVQSSRKVISMPGPVVAEKRSVDIQEKPVRDETNSEQHPKKMMKTAENSCILNNGKPTSTVRASIHTPENTEDTPDQVAKEPETPKKTVENGSEAAPNQLASSAFNLGNFLNDNDRLVIYVNGTFNAEIKVCRCPQ